VPQSRSDLKTLIVSATKDPNKYVRFSAVHALHLAADPGDLPLLGEIEASDPDPDVRDQARRAIKAIQSPHA
ncbi:MAG: HEAT repeat domain-containing protein, partial [Streptosporangiaceae bacterium]